MAVASLDVKQYTGAAPTKTVVTTPRLSTSDSSSPGTSNPIPIPSSDFNYSYWMTLHLVIAAMNDATLLNNHRFYSDGAIGWSMGTSGELRIGKRDSGDNGVPEASYDQATGSEGTTGNDMEDGTDGHDYYKGQTTPSDNIENYTSGSTLLVDSGDHEAAEAFKGVVVQAKIDTDAVRGAQASETLTFQYDEV